MEVTDELLEAVAERIYERLTNKQWKFAPHLTKLRYLDVAHSTLLIVKLMVEDK